MACENWFLCDPQCTQFSQALATKSTWNDWKWKHCAARDSQHCCDECKTVLSRPLQLRCRRQRNQSMMGRLILFALIACSNFFESFARPQADSLKCTDLSDQGYRYENWKASSLLLWSSRFCFFHRCVPLGKCVQTGQIFTDGSEKLGIRQDGISRKSIFVCLLKKADWF